MSLVTGFQLDVFRSWSGGNHNTTICTGNLRTMGQLFYAELFHRTDATGKKALTYAGLLLSFPLGAAVGALLCLWLGGPGKLGGRPVPAGVGALDEHGREAPGRWSEDLSSPVLMLPL